MDAALGAPKDGFTASARLNPEREPPAAETGRRS
jgi:hypothetical protein